MESIIKKAIEGGYKPSEIYLEETAYGADYQFHAISTDPLFWQALGKACGWENSERYWSVEQEVKITLLDSWENTAMTFHHKNLTEGWNQAVAYLQEVTK